MNDANNTEAKRQVKRLNKLEQHWVVYDVSIFIEKAHISATESGRVSPSYTESERLQNSIHATIQHLYGIEASDRLPKATERRLMSEVRNDLQFRFRTNESFRGAMIKQSRLREEFKTGKITFDGKKILNPKH